MERNLQDRNSRQGIIDRFYERFDEMNRFQKFLYTVFVVFIGLIAIVVVALVTGTIFRMLGVRF
jgi:hypothetical protein